MDSLQLEWFPNAAHHALQTDTCDVASPQHLHLGSLEFQTCPEARVAAGACLALCITFRHKVTQLIIQAENSGFLPSELGLVPVV